MARASCAHARTGERSASKDRKSTRLNSSHSQISYAVFCLKKKKREIREERACRDWRVFMLGELGLHLDESDARAGQVIAPHMSFSDAGHLVRSEHAAWQIL